MHLHMLELQLQLRASFAERCFINHEWTYRSGCQSCSGGSCSFRNMRADTCCSNNDDRRLYRSDKITFMALKPLSHSLVLIAGIVSTEFSRGFRLFGILRPPLSLKSLNVSLTLEEQSRNRLHSSRISSSPKSISISLGQLVGLRMANYMCNDLLVLWLLPFSRSYSHLYSVLHSY